MRTRGLWVASILFTVLAFGAECAHLLELPNKLQLSKNDYKLVQQIYRGWAGLGIAIFIAFVSSLMLTIKLRYLTVSFNYTLAATICIGLCLAVFFVFIFPVNQATNNWAELPDNWEQLRQQWEYAHAINAFIYFIAVLMLSLAMYTRR